jgi:hypothetical protein
MDSSVLGDSIIANRTCSSTKAQYKRKVDHFKAWIVKEYPQHAINGGEDIALPDLGQDILKQFFGHICRKRNRDDSYVTPIEYQSFQHVSGYKSAIKDYYHAKRVKLSNECDSMLKDFFQGYERKIAELKQSGEKAIIEGKQPLSFSGYRFLAKKAFRQSTDHMQGIFAHFFLLLCWNLISRCVSVASLMYDHISWEEDSMVIVFPSHKGDKEGKNSAPKHIYANRTCPEICPILAFSIFLFTCGYRRSGSRRDLFGGINETEARFSKWLKHACGTSSNELLLMGLIISEIGTHSFRKGIATFLSSIPGGPTAIAIYLRAGWSLGPVQSRYILEGQGGDQLCGRAATGLSLTEMEFADLPPHFDMSCGPILAIDQWEDILPGYSTYYPASFRQVVPFLLASLVYHRDFLLSTLPQSHPLFIQRVWTGGIMDLLKEKVLYGCGRHPISKLSATGIPPHILLANEIVQLKGDMNVLRSELMSKFESLPEDLKRSMLDNFQVNGTVPITHSQIAAMINDLKSSVNTSIVQAIEQHTANLGGTAMPFSHDSSPSQQFQTWMWKDRLHPVPQSFKFPKCNVRSLWDLWWVGNATERIAPYRGLKAFDLDNKNDNQLLSKAKFVITTLIKYSNDSNLDGRALQRLPARERDRAFETSFIAICKELFPSEDNESIDRRKIGDISFITLYDLLKKKLG